MADTFPTKNWRWPNNAPGVPATTGMQDGVAGYVRVDPAIPPPVEGVPAPVVIDQLRRDRDELLAALEAMLDEHDGEMGPCSDDGCRTKRALIARIRAGK